MEFEAVVEDIIVRTQYVKSFRFVRPSWFSYKAGQFTFVTVEVGGQKIRKPLTLSSSPTELDYIEFTKKLTGHPFSNGLDALRIVDKVELDAPYGNFTLAGRFTTRRNVGRRYGNNSDEKPVQVLYGYESAFFGHASVRQQY